jgi:hypothetical protein
VETPSERLVYSRADVISAVAGEVVLRRAYTRQLELPSESCEGGPFTCATHRLYGQVYSLAFFEETYSRRPDGGAGIERKPRGRLLIAFNLSKRDEDDFEDGLTARLGILSVAEFDRPQAGLGWMEPPLTSTTIEKSADHAWVCTENDNAFGCDVMVVKGLTERSSSGVSAESASKAGRAIAAAVADVEPTTLRTIPDVRSQTRWEVTLASASALAGATWASDLVTVPKGVKFEKKALKKDEMTGGLRDVHDGTYVGHEGRFGDVEREVHLPRASLDLAGRPMWVARWAFTETRDRFGADPKSEKGPTVSILVGLAPLADPLMEPLERSKTEIVVPEERIALAAVIRFGRNATLDPSLVAEALADPEIWPARGDWIVVTCRDDGSARYGISPFADAAEVGNPREACAAIRRLIGD